MAIRCKNDNFDYHNVVTGQTEAGDVGSNWPGNRHAPPGPYKTIAFYAVDLADKTICKAPTMESALAAAAHIKGAKIRRVYLQHEAQEAMYSEEREEQRFQRGW